MRISCQKVLVNPGGGEGWAEAIEGGAAAVASTSGISRVGRYWQVAHK